MKLLSHHRQFHQVLRIWLLQTAAPQNRPQSRKSATEALSDDDLLTADEPVAAISDSELAESLTPEEQEALEQAAAEKKLNWLL